MFAITNVRCRPLWFVVHRLCAHVSHVPSVVQKSSSSQSKSGCILWSRSSCSQTHKSPKRFGTSLQLKYVPTHTPPAPLLANVSLPAQEVYQYLHGPFFKHVWGGGSFDGEVTNNQTIPKGSKSFRNRPGWFSGTSRFIGGIRVGSTRSANYDCVLPPAFAAHASEFACFEEYSEADPDTAPFGYPDLLDLKFGSSQEPIYWSPISSDAFGSPSAYLVLPNVDGPEDADGQTPILRKLKALQRNHFIDAKTRVVSVDLTVYNPSLDFTVLVRLSIELNPGGSVVPTYHLQTLRLYSTYDPADMFRSAVEILVLLMVLGYMLKEIVNLCRYGPLKYWFEHASAVHVANLVLFIVAAGYRIRGLTLLPDVVDPTTAEFVNFLDAADALDYATNINALYVPAQGPHPAPAP